MLRTKRFIAGFLCMVMLFTSVPFEAFATETSEETPGIESLVEAAMNSNSTPAAVDVEAESTEPTVVEDEQTVYTEEENEPTDPTEVETEPTDPTEEETEPTDPTEEETEPTDPTEVETEPTDPTEEETEPTDPTEEETEPTDPTEEETEPTDPIEEEPHWIYSVNDEGYAVIEGYTDYTASSLSIPYTIDGYYVVAIGEKAFVNNTALTKMYVHGNVQTIAADAFDGLGLVLSGYNGTAVASYTSEQGFDFRMETDQDYLKFTDKVIDFSYAEDGRYSYINATTIKMAMPEALQLSVGKYFFLPEAYEDLLGVYEVLSVAVHDGYAIFSVQNAPYEEVLASLSISGEELHADWSQAEWEDGVEIVEEKWSSSLEGSINIGYKKELGKNKVSWPGSDGEKVFGESGAEFFIEGKFALKGTATVDVDIGLFSAEVKDMSLILEPSLNVKTGIKFDIVDNKSVNTKTPIEMVKPKDYTYKIGSVPLVSASGVLTVKTAIYAKVSASGEVTITFGGQGELGFKWNKNKSDFDGVNKWKWNTPTINGSVTVEVGPCYAVELHCAVLGKVVSVELFAGGVLEAKATIHFGAGGSTDVNTGQTSSTELGICSDIDLDGKVSVTLKLELDLLKKVVGKKGEVYSQTGYSWELFSAKKDIWDTHWEWRKDFIGFLDDCTYETTNTVRFCTFTTEQLKSLEVMYNATFPEPELKKVADNKLLGWYTDKNYTDQWDFEEDKVTADMTLYAKWEKSSKTVAFVTQDDQVGATDWTELYVPGSYVTEPAVRIKQWKLNGWYLDEELTDQWDFTKDVMPNKDLTLYGSWTYDENYDPFISSGGKNYTISGGKLYYNGHVYQHVATYELFSAARADAESQGAYLVTISSKEEMDAVLDYVQDDCAQQTLWLGINSTTDWKYWLNGEKMTYWNGEDPETTSSQYNGIFYRASGDWDTYDNGSTSHYIMEWGDYTVDPGFAQYASSSTDGSAQYTVSDSGDSVSVVGFAGGEEVNISNLYDGLLVTEIDAYAFQNNTTVKSITIPSTVEKIGNYAFTGCTALEEITIPASVTSIGTNAFEGCTSLKKVILPDGITVLPASIFSGCTKLEEILNTEDLTEIQQYAFYGCTSLESFTVPSKLTTIGMYAFSGCSGLKKIVFNSEITTIGRYAFQGCTNLSGSITIPKTCTSIGYDAFYNCSSLDHVFLSSNRSAIGSDAFYGVNATFHGKSDDGIDTWCQENNKDFVDTDGQFRVHFMPLAPLPTLPVVPGVKDESMLEDLYLTSGAYITEPVITLEGYILEGWYLDPDFTDKWDFARDKVGYEDITLYAKWVEESSIFQYYVEAGNAYISEYNGSDENVVIPATLGGCTVVGIAAGAFTGLETVKSISIPAKVSSIEAKAFEGCLNLYTIAFPQGNDNFTVTNGILYSADMTELIYAAEARTFTSFVVPDSVVRIYGGAFGNHADLTKVEIPASVVEIGENAFPTSSFLTVYGPDAECAAKKYANDNGLGYNEYLVTFYDGSNILFSSVIETGELLVEFAEFESEYATYAGWYRDSACTVAWDFATDTMPASNLNLYLKWDSDFAVEDGAAGLTITQYVGTNSTIVIPEKINDTTVTGIAANAFVSTADAPIISVSIPDCVTEIAASAITGNPAPTVIAAAGSAAQAYAEADGLAFEKKAYMVSFEVNGGAEIPPIALIPGETAVLPVPIKSNNHFLGWYTTNFYTTAWTDTTVMPEEDITLYARWQVINSQVNNDFSYAVAEDGNAVITGYHGTKTVLSIPSTINGYPVTAIGDFAFAENKTVLTYIIPSTVLTIGEFAFSNSAIERITGGSGVVSIGESCFSGANALRTPFIPDGIKEIPGYCFEYCNSITDILVPDTITAIGDYAFYGCNFLSNAEISESVTQIGTGAFAGCESLKSVNVPSSLKGLGNDVFGSAEVHYFAANSLRIISVKQLTKDSIQISWNEVANADGYRLSRKKGTSGDYLLIKSITDTTTSNYSLTSGVTYYYKVVAYEEGAIGTTILAESDEHMIRVARMSTPTISSVQIASSESANMNWTKVVGAEGYEVWRAYELNGEYSLLKTVTDTVTTNSGLVGGRTYFYKVRAFYNDGSTTEYSSFSDVYQFTMPLVYMNIPKNVTVRQTATGTVLLEWDPVEDADGYNIYRKRGNGNLSLVKTTLETSTYNYNLVLGETYGYAVEAYCNTDKATITGQKSDVISVTIGSLATPYVKSVSQSAVQTALVSWTSISAADGYELWRSRTENGTYSLMKAVTGTATSNYNLSVGGTYYYKVRAYVTGENEEKVYSAYSNAVPITILSVAKTRLKSVVQADATSSKITWAYMSGAKSYEVWRSVNDNKHYELIRTTSGTAIQDRNLIDGQTYYYKVRAYDDSGETVVYGDFSDELYLCVIGAPVIATLEQNSSNSVFITWDKVNNADGYELARSTDGNSYSSVKTIEAASTYNFNLTAGETYHYKIRAYKTVDDAKVYGNYSKPLAIKILGTPDVTSLLQNGKDGIKLAWSVDDHAEGYELWRTLTEDKGVFTKVKNVTGTSTTSFGLYETVATYKLRSYATVNGKKVYGPFGDPMSITMLGTPIFLEALQSSTSSATLSWNEITGATSYKVYRSSSPDTGFTLIKTVTGTETTTYSLKSGNTYYFKLKAVMNENGVAHEGAYSEAMSVYVSDIVAPYIKNCKQTAEGVTLTATLNGTVDGIELWRADAASTFTQVADSTTNTISDTTCYGGNSYQYKIRSYKIVDDARVYSAFSSMFVMDMLETPRFSRVSQTGKNTVYLKWTLVDGATKYEISRSADNGENYTSIGTFEGDSAEDAISATGTYLYRIRASATAGSNTKCTEWSSDTSITVQVYTNTTYPETPHNYSNNLNQIYTYTQEGAEALSLTFSSSSSTESGHDYIYVFDGSGYCVGKFSGSIGGKTLVTAGDTFQLYFTADGSRTSYGFSFASITEASLDDVTDPAYSWRISGNTIFTDGSDTLTDLNNRSVFNHLTEIVVEPGTTGLSTGMMKNVTSVTKVTLPDGLTSIGNEAFRGCTGITEINIPNTVTSIGNYAFYGCSSLASINIPASVTKIGQYTFGYCTGVKTIVIPETVEAINSYAFQNCTSLTDVTLSTTTDYGYYYSSATARGIFDGCTNLNNITFSDEPVKINNGLFAGSGIQKITIPATVTEIGAYAFANCAQLTDVVYAGNAVTKIGDYAFASATTLTAAPIPDGIIEIGSYAFARCSSIKSVTIPDTVPQMNTRTFEHCTALTDVIFKSHPAYTYNYDGAKAYGIFNGCSNLTNVTFDCEITTIGKALFAGSGIKSITIPATATAIDDYAFSNCTKLTEVVYAGNSVTTLGKYAFASATALTTAPIPDEIKEIEEYAFTQCSSIKSVTIPDTVPQLNRRTFENCTALTDVIFKSHPAYTYNYDGAKAYGIFNGCSNLTNVTFDCEITTIGKALFAGSGIKSITIPETVTQINDYAFASCSKLQKVNYEGNAITTLGNYAFANCAALISAPIPTGITEIGTYAYYNCAGITEVSLNDNITSIGAYAFANCSGLTKINLPESLTKIDARAFENCTGLTDLTIPASFGTVSTAYASGKGVFNGCTALTNITFEEGITKIPAGAFAGSGIREIVIPETVTEIGSYAFSYCTKLRTMELPEGLTTINSYAFQYCSILKRFTLPSTLTTLGSYAFQYCYDLTSVTIPVGVTTINSYLFRNCTSLNTVVIPGPVTAINDYAFNGCSNLKNITIPGTVTTISSNAFNGLVATTAGPIGGGYDYEFGWAEAIPASAFRNMSKLTNAVIPEGITSIGSYAFHNSGITSISLPTTLKTIADNAFYNCDGLTSIVIPNGVTSIGNRAFYSCGALKQISMPGTVTSISDSVFEGVAATTAGPIGGGYDYEFGWTEAIPASAFRNMAKLANAVIPEGITTIGSYAFHNSGITSINLPSTLKTIADNAFYNCDGLTSIVIPEGTTTIGNRTFYGCNNLKNISMPGTVTSISDGVFAGIAVTTAGPVGGGYDYEFGWTETIPASAFRSMSKLTTAVIPEGISNLGSYAFCDSSLTGINLPSTLKTIADHCFYNCDGLTSIVIPEGTTTIGNRTFYGCNNLKNISIPGTVTSISDGVFAGIAVTTAGPVGGGYDYEFGWTETIPASAFRSMSKLTTAVIPEGISNLGSYAFCDSSLTGINLPSTLKTIADHCFYNCDGLTGIVIPEGTTTIGNRTFYNSGKLASVTIPDTVTAIGNDAFTGCSSSLILYCTDDSYAASYAASKGIAHQTP